MSAQLAVSDDLTPSYRLASYRLGVQLQDLTLQNGTIGDALLLTSTPSVHFRDDRQVAVRVTDDSAQRRATRVNWSLMLDTDDDRLSDRDEVQVGSDPFMFDTDGDLMGDGFEHASTSLHPLAADNIFGDPDGDLLKNLHEEIHGTSPDLMDTDGDGFSDGMEVNVPRSR